MNMVNIMAKLENLDDFLEELIKMGDIEPVDVMTQIQNREFSIKASEENVERTIDFNNLEAFDKKKNKEIIEKLDKIKDNLNLKENTGTKRLSDEKINEIYDKSESLLKRKEELLKKKEVLKKQIENMKLLKEYGISLEELHKLKYFDYKLGEVSEDGKYILKNNYENIPSLIIHLNNDNTKREVNLNALEKIYSIDKNTQKLRENTDKVLEKEKNNTKDVLLNMDKKYSEGTKSISHDIEEKSTESSKEEIQETKKNYHDKMTKLENRYNDIKNELEDDIFEQITR